MILGMILVIVLETTRFSSLGEKLTYVAKFDLSPPTCHLGSTVLTCIWVNVQLVKVHHTRNCLTS